MKRKSVLWTMIAVFLVIVVSPIHALKKIDKAFMKLNKAFAPALYYTAVQDKNNSAKHAKSLKSEWNKFRKSYARYKWLKDGWGEWKDTFKIANKNINEGIKQVGKNKLASANSHFKKANKALKELHSICDLTFFPDGLGELETAINSLEKLAKPMQGKKIDNKKLIEFKKQSSKIIEAWEHISKTEINEDLFGFNDARMKKLSTYIEAIDEAIEQFKDTIVKKKKSDIVKKALAIKPKYLELVKIFW